MLQQNHSLSKRIAIEVHALKAQGTDRQSAEGEHSEGSGTLKHDRHVCGPEQNVNSETRSQWRYPGVGLL